jgi:hypothetical protein
MMAMVYGTIHRAQVFHRIFPIAYLPFMDIFDWKNINVRHATKPSFGVDLLGQCT